MHIWVQMGGWAHRHRVQTHRSEVHPGHLLHPKPKQHRDNSILKQRELRLIAHRLLTDHLKDEAPSPTVSSRGTAACCSGQKQGPSQDVYHGGSGPATPQGTGMTQPVRQGPPHGGDKAEPSSGQEISWGPQPGRGMVELEPSTPTAKL